jgi:hypothetical protein
MNKGVNTEVAPPDVKGLAAAAAFKTATISLTVYNPGVMLYARVSISGVVIPK